MPSISKEFQDIDKLRADGSNWRIFETRITFAARAMSLEPVLKAETAWNKTDADKKLEQEQAAAQLVNAIVQKLPDALLRKYMKYSRPDQVWTALKVEFGKVSIAATAAIEAQMFALTCKPNGNMRKYIDHMLEYDQQLSEAGVPLDDTRLRDAIITGARTCGPAYIAVIEALAASYTANSKEAELTSALFIASLRSTHDSLHVHISGGSRSDTSAHTATTDGGQCGRGNGRGRGGRGRGRGNSRGGPPQGNNRAQQGTQERSTPLKCFRCGGLGHRANDCGTPADAHVGKKTAKLAHAAMTGSSGSTSAATTSAATDSSSTASTANAATTALPKSGLSAWSAVSALQGECTNTPITISGPAGDFLAAGAAVSSSPIAIFDSGASEHFTPLRERLTNIRAIAPIPINAANNTVFHGTARGTMVVKLATSSTITQLTLRDVIYAPGMSATLISMGKLDANGFDMRIKAGELSIKAPDGTLCGAVPRVDGLYRLGGSPASPTALSATTLTLYELHRRLGHRNYAALLDMLRNSRLQGISVTDHTQVECRECRMAKATRAPIARLRLSPLAKEYGEHRHMDVWGPAATATVNRARYFLMIVDDAKRWMSPHTLVKKSDAFARYRVQEKLDETQYGVVTKILQSDRGGEFLSELFDEHLEAKGIVRKLTVHDTPEHDGVSERHIRTIVDTMRTYFAASGLPRWLWGECLRHAAWVLNRSAHKALGGLSPFEARFGVVPDISGLWEWGAWVYVHSTSKNKLDPRAAECRWLGFDESSNGHRVYWPARRVISVERSIRLASRQMRDDEGELQPVDLGPIEDDASDAPSRKAPVIEDKTLEPDVDDEPAPQEIREPVDPLIIEGPRKRAPSRKILAIQQGIGATLAQAFRSPAVPQSVFAAMTNGIPSDQVSDALAAATADASGDPRTVAEAMRSPDWPKWQEAMAEEVRRLEARGTWVYADHPGVDINVITSKWVFRTKRDADGNIIGYRARIVARGFTQQDGIDFNADDTFAPVVKMASARMLLGMAARNGWLVHQLDVKSAYLYGKLQDDETIYMAPPTGISLAGMKRGQVLRLILPIYGLKQAGRRWYTELRRALGSIELIRCEHDHAVFLRRHPNGEVSIIFVHVDDMSLIAPTAARMKELKERIKQIFEVTDGGELSWLLGVQIKFDRKLRTVSLSQHSYLRTIIERAGMTDARTLSTPSDQHVSLTSDMSPRTPEDFEFMRTVNFRENLGALMYAAVATRPDISHAVSQVARYQDNPGPAHVTALKRIFAYLKGTFDYELVIGGGDTVHLGFCDADGHSTEGRHAVSGYVFTLGGGAISWSSKRQELVTLSTTEAEYVAMTHAAKEAIWVQSIHAEIFHEAIQPFPLCGDNQSAISLVCDDRFHARTKHIDIRYHFIRELVECGKLALTWIPSADNVADIFTKALPAPQHKLLASRLGLRRNA
jgi:hypothetical protein